MAPPVLSLSVPTFGRTVELARLLRSLAHPATPAVEVIVVDQNADDRVDAVMHAAVQRVVGADREAVSVRHIRTGRIGASAARNLGAAHASADLIAFPDDDCWFAAGMLGRAVEWMHEHRSHSALCVMARDASGASTTARWWPHASEVTRRHVFRQSIEFATFVRTSVFRACGGFDPAIGPGADSAFGASEVADLLLRLLATGARAHYEPALSVGHDEPVRTFDERAFARARGYGRGMGHVMRRHGYGPMSVARVVGRPLVGATIALGAGNPGLAQFRWLVATHRFRGWIGC